jgi:hypothetical protein
LIVAVKSLAWAAELVSVKLATAPWKELPAVAPSVFGSPFNVSGLLLALGGVVGGGSIGIGSRIG